MADKPFDPYHKWLGIAPAEQPPNHYRLLSIDLFESDADIIEAAANRQMMFIKQYGTGPYSEFSQKLLNELSAARITLLNTEKKAAYDAKLKKKLQAAKAHEETPAPPAAPPIQIAADPSQSIVEKSKKKSKNSNLIIAAVVVNLFIGFGIYRVLQRPAEETSPDNSVAITNSDQPVDDPTKLATSENPSSGDSDPEENTSDASTDNNPTVDLEKLAKSLSSPVVDLLKKIDPVRDPVQGDFLLVEGKLSWEQYQGNRLQIPSVVPEEYDLIVKASRTSNSGYSALALGILVGGHQALAFIDGYYGSGFETLNGKDYNRNEAFNSEKGLFKADQESTIVVSVRKSSVKITFDEKTLIDWEGDPSQLAVPKSWEIPNEKALSIGGNAGYIVSKLELRPPTEPEPTPQTEPTPETKPTPQLAGSVDLLKKIDLERDAVRGDFSLENERLTWKIRDKALVEIPGDVPQEYDLVVTSSRTEGYEGFVIGFLVDGRQTLAVIDASRGSGLQRVDDKGYSENETNNKERKLFQPGKESTIVCRVRKTSVKITIDDKTLIEWEGDPASLSMDSRWAIPNKDVLFIGGNAVHTISRLELRPLSAADMTPKLAGSPEKPQTKENPTTKENPQAKADQQAKVDQRKKVDLLKKVDPQRHAVVGNFSLEDEKLTWQQVNQSRIQIPCDVPEEYDLIVTASRPSTSGYTALALGLVVGGHQTLVIIDSSYGNGFHRLDNKGYSQNESSNGERGLFKPGKESTIVCSVRKSAVKITFDGKTLIDWKGDPARLSVDSYWVIPNQQSLFLGGYTVYSISKLEMRIVDSSTRTSGTAAALANRHPIPEEAARNQAIAAIKDLFEDDYKNAKSSTKKAELGQKLYQQALENQNDITGRYVMLSEARKIATDVVDTQTALDATELLTNEYEIDSLKTNVETIATLVKSARFPAQKKPLAARSFALVDEAIAADDYETATELATIAYNAARSAKLRDFTKVIVARRKEIEEVTEEFEKTKEAIDLLKENPDDPAANLTVGKLFCYFKGDWVNGLPMFVKSDDEELKTLAEKELAMPTTTEQQVAVGNGWWQFAKDQPLANRNRIESHAAYWYIEALSDLTGLQKLSTEKRLAELQAKGLLDTPGFLKRRVAISACGTSDHNIYLNGTPLMKCSYRNAINILQTLKVGDIISVRLGGSFNYMNLWMFFQTEQREKLFETSDRWTAYRPANLLRWWEVDSEGTVYQPAQYVSSTRSYVEGVMTAAEKAVPVLPKSLPIFSTLPGETAKSPTFIYYVVTASDLLPGTNAKK